MQELDLSHLNISTKLPQWLLSENVGHYMTTAMSESEERFPSPVCKDTEGNLESSLKNGNYVILNRAFIHIPNEQGHQIHRAPILVKFDGLSTGHLLINNELIHFSSAVNSSSIEEDDNRVSDLNMQEPIHPLQRVMGPANYIRLLHRMNPLHFVALRASRLPVEFARNYRVPELRVPYEIDYTQLYSLPSDRVSGVLMSVAGNAITSPTKPTTKQVLDFIRDDKF